MEFYLNQFNNNKQKNQALIKINFEPRQDYAYAFSLGFAHSKDWEKVLNWEDSPI